MWTIDDSIDDYLTPEEENARYVKDNPALDQMMIPFASDYWYTQYRRSYSKYLAEAIREKRKFSRYDYLQI